MSLVLVSPLISSLKINLNSLLQYDTEVLRSVHQEIEILLNSLLSIEAAVIDGAEAVQGKEQKIAVWLRKLKEAAYDADNIAEELTYEVLQSNIGDAVVGASEEIHAHVSSLLDSFMDRFKDIREKMDELSAEAAVFDLGIVDSRLEADRLQQMNFVSEEMRLYGREEDKENVVGLLLNNGDPFIVMIVGGGGIGKTTLAQLAYDDERVEQHFEVRMWFSLSEDLDVERLTKEIVDCAIGKPHWIVGLYELERCLREELSGKAFLLVLDGLWCKDQKKWNGLKRLLSCGAKGSKIMVTTRTQVVGSIMERTVPYCMDGLSDNDCWYLFRQEAFGLDRPEEFQNLVAIGKEIVKKCQGVPLGVKSVGRLLRFRRQEHEWLTVKDSKIWNNSTENDRIISALKLCYKHLSLHAQECFSYCSVFPKDYEIEKQKLIELWMANGFIPSRGGMEMEDIGHQIFVELLSSSFFQITDKDGNGYVKCKLHDAAHDLARSIRGNECLNWEAKNTHDLPKGVCHLSYSDATSLTEILKSLREARKLRSFLLVSNYDASTRIAFPQNISKFRFLRVLDLRYADIRTLPISLENMKHLRYLDLSYSNIEALPKSLSSHQYLQTLKLRGCACLHLLPENINNMVSLRHLDISECWSLHQMPRNIGQLSCLQVLTSFIIGKENGVGIKELGCLNLRGELGINKLGNVRNSITAKDANLKAKKHLRSLELSWYRVIGRQWKEDSDTLRANDEEVLEDLEPHPSLKKFHLDDYAGIRFPRWMMDSSLRNLEYIRIFRCTKCEILPPLGGLPFLKDLFIEDMRAVKCLGTEFCSSNVEKPFPSLNKLTIKEMTNLEKWVGAEGREAYANLRELIMEGCPVLTNLPWFPSLKDLEISNCNGAILQSVRTLTSLSSLCLDEFPEVASLPKGLLQKFTHLKSLDISRFPELTSLDEELKDLSSLESLRIYACMNLISLPDDGTWQGLTSLRLLSIWYCRNMPSLPEGLQCLTSLRTLDIYGCDKLASLPAGLRKLTTLQDLRISECDVLTSPEWLPQITTLQDLCIKRSPSLMALPDSIKFLTTLRCIQIEDLDNLTSLPEGIQHLTALETLEIISCRKLSSLPEWLGELKFLRRLSIWFCPAITTLPAALQQLTALEHLSIRYCPDLERRCKKGTGEDWQKIAHIPHVIIQSLPHD